MARSLTVSHSTIMYLSQTNIVELRQKVDQDGGFQIAIAPMQPATFMNVQIATDNLYKKLVESGFTVLVDDRGQKPKNMFEVIAFLGIQHRVVISSRSISKGMYEYKDLETDYFEKVAESEMCNFLQSRVV